MDYLAKIVDLELNVEGEVFLLVNGLTLCCFVISSLPEKAKKGDIYRIEFSPIVWDNYIVQEVKGNASPTITYLGKAFTYLLTGILEKDCLNINGIVFQDEVLLSEFGYLGGKMISWKVDRLDVDFLSSNPINNSV